MERAAYLAPSLSTLSVVPTVSTTYSEPFHVSSQLASIDHLASGRSGWVVATSPTGAAARTWGRDPVLDLDGLAREATDAVRVVRDLWDSWEDDAVVRDVTSSRYLDRDRLHYIDFAGETYSVKGPAIVPRPPQGQVVVLAPAGLLPDDLVDVVLITAPICPESRSRPRRAGSRGPSSKWKWPSTLIRRRPMSGWPTWHGTDRGPTSADCDTSAPLRGWSPYSASWPSSSTAPVCTLWC